MIKVLNDDVNDCRFPFLDLVVLLASSNSISHKIWDKKIEHLLELYISFNSTIAPDKLDFLLKLLEVNVAAPAPSNKHPDCAPVTLNGFINLKPATHKVKEDKH